MDRPRVSPLCALLLLACVAAAKDDKNAEEEETGFGSALNNNIMFGTLSVMLLSSAAGALYLVASNVWDQVCRTFLVTVRVTNNDEAFTWLLEWLRNQNSFVSANKLTITTVKDSKKWFWQTDFKDKKPTLAFLPGQGIHMFMYKKRLFWMNRYNEGNAMTQGWDNKPFTPEAIVISTIGRSKGVFEELFKECMEASYTKDQNKTQVYVLDNWGDDWKCALKKAPRTFESVILDSDYSQRLLEDARKFMKSEQWYTDNGIPYRRGYLIYGPPGTGKTSFVQALAGEMKLNICVLSLTSKSLRDENLNMALNAAPANAIVLLEDVDAVFVDRSTAEKGPQGVSFSGLLNAIDGVASQEGRLFFMTTNHLERLDPALIRPGRCDVKIKFDYASHDQVYNMFIRFFPGELDLAREFAESIPQNTVSMAQLQGHFLGHKEDPLDCRNSVKEVVKEAVEGPDKVEDVRVKTWLRRLGLSQYSRTFRQWQLSFLSEIKPLNVDVLLEKLAINHPLHAQRLRGMLEGAEDAKRGYTMANLADTRTIFLRFYPNKAVELERFVHLVPPGTVSVYQLEGHFANYADSAQMALQHVDEIINDHPPRHSIAMESVDDWLTRMGVGADAPLPTFDEFVRTAGVDVKKLSDAEITDVDQLISWDVAKFKEYGVEKEGAVWRLTKLLLHIKTSRVRSNISSKGINSLEQMLEFDDGKLEGFGISSSGHRWNMLKDLKRLKEKREREVLQYEMLVPDETPRYTPDGAFPEIKLSLPEK